MAQRNRASYKRINFIEHKLCTGPLHKQGLWVPVSNFYIRRDGRLRAHCKPCDSCSRGAERMVPIVDLKFALDELTFRLGKAEASRRIGISDSTFWYWTTGKQKCVRRASARKIVQVLLDARAQEEARHRLSIRSGAAQRGREEKVPRHISDFNGPNNISTQLRRRYRHANAEKERVKERERWQKRKGLTRAA